MIRSTEWPQVPYYAVIFTSMRTDQDESACQEMAQKMLAFASTQQGYPGFESFRDVSGKGVSISYWTDLQAIDRWASQFQHRQAQLLGKEKWYQYYRVEVSRVERTHVFER